MTNESSTDSAGESGGYIKTAAHNYVSRDAHVHGATHVELRGKSIVYPRVILRGDLGGGGGGGKDDRRRVSLRIGRYVVLNEGTVVRPPFVSTSLDDDSDGTSGTQALPVSIGDHTSIGADCVLESLSIGSSVVIGNECVLGPRSIVKDCCVIEDGTVVPPDAVIPPFCRVRGRPGRIVEDGTMPESWAVLGPERAAERFASFVKEREAIEAKGDGDGGNG